MLYGRELPRARRSLRLSSREYLTEEPAGQEDGQLTDSKKYSTTETGRSVL